METLVLVIHCLVASVMVGLILLQQGKGAEAGASFGAGASQTVFGAAGAASFLTKLTAWLAGIFMVTSLTLAVYARKDVQAHNQLVLPATLTAPTPAVAPAHPGVPGTGDLPQLPVH